ncbi:MAG: heme biosynthesis HemY N-terminal domain-containing protein [Pseudomonadota bacterium]
MKRAPLWLLAALVLGAVAGQLMLDDPGYLLVTWQAWVIETSLWVALIAVILLFLALLLALGLANTLVDAVSHWQRRRGEQQTEKARRLTEAGLARYAEADWRKATSTLMKAAELVDVPLPVRLTSARAAEQDGRYDLAEQILREARQGAGDAAPLVDVRLAALKLRQGDVASARLLLERLREKLPKHPRAMRLLVDVYLRLQDWRALTAMLPAMKAHLSGEEWQELGRRAWLGHLAAVAGEAGYSSRKARIDALNAAWKAMPAEFRADEQIAAQFIGILLTQDAGPDAQALLEKLLAGSWSDRLAAIYGRIDAENPAAQLATAEKWLTLRPTNAVLLLATGRISLRNRLWGKARDYFEASAARDTNAEICAELVRLYSRLGENTKAEQFLRRHAELTGTDLPKLPLPTARI